MCNGLPSFCLKNWKAQFMLLTVIKVYVYTQDHCTISTGESLK